MYEELLNENEVFPKQVFPKIFIGKATNLEINICQDFMESFKYMTEEEIRTRLLDIVNNRVSVKSLNVNSNTKSGKQNRSQNEKVLSIVNR